jgi:hypothetical protein
MATLIDLNTTTWTEIGTNLTTAIIQIEGRDAEVFIGGSTPANSVIGYTIPADVPVSLPSIAALGGGVWAKGDGSARYDTA